MIAHNKEFKDIAISLDGSSFYGCTFRRCKMTYSGLLPVTLEKSTFDNCEWAFDGAAMNTANLLKALYAAGAQQMVEATFDNIRGTAPQSGSMKLN
jgi:uncharacterized protein YjbI with pentapeptide repeats